MEDIPENVDTSLSLGNTLSPTDPSSSRSGYRKKPRKQPHPMSTYSPPPLLRPTKTQLQPGCLIKIQKRTDLYDMFAKAGWEPMLYYHNRKVMTNLVSDFYNNMEIRHGVHGVVFLTTVVGGRPLLLDHIELGKVLKLAPKISKMATIDITKNFVFDKDELRLALSVLCGLELPQSFVLTDEGVSYEHFTPTFQTLAMIIRKNVFPNTNGSKLMCFHEIKLLYKLACHKVAFNLPYMIILKMIDGFKKGYMLYGLTLTKVFEYFKINVKQLPHFQVASTISDMVNCIVVPLPGTSLPPPPPLIVDLEQNECVPMATDSTSEKEKVEEFDFEKKFLELKESNDALDKLLKELQGQFKELVEKYEGMEARMTVLIEILGNTVTRAGRIEEGVSSVISAQLALYDLPSFLPMIGSLDDAAPVMAQRVGGPMIVSEVSDMETEAANTQVLQGLEDID